MTRPTKDALIEYLLCGNDHDDMAALCAEMFGGSARSWAKANTSEALAAEYVDRLDFAALMSLQDEVIEQNAALDINDKAHPMHW